MQIDINGPSIFAFRNKRLTDLDTRYCKTEKKIVIKTSWNEQEIFLKSKLTCMDNPGFWS